MKRSSNVLFGAVVIMLLGAALLWWLRAGHAGSSSAADGPLKIRIVGLVATSAIPPAEYLKGRDRFFELNSQMESPARTSDLLLEASNNGNGVVEVMAFSTSFWWPRIEVMQSNRWINVGTSWSTANSPRVILQPGQKMQIGCPAFLYPKWRVGFGYTETPPPTLKARIASLLSGIGIRAGAGTLSPQPHSYQSFSPAMTTPDQTGE